MKTIVFIFSFLATIGYAQTRLVMDGALINIGGGANLVIDNSNANAITRNAGHVISETENSNVVWKVGLATGTYIIPFGFGSSDYLPLIFTKSSGTGTGIFTFATYKTTDWQNSLNLPTGVPNVNNTAGSDNSANVIDRFWKMEATGYTVKPDLTNLIFTYRDLEHNLASNSIVEANLIPQRYNSMLTDWGDFLPTATINTTTNEVSIASLSNTQLFTWWTLTNNASPLPVELIYFNAALNNTRTVDLTWVTASEINNDYFIVQRSNDGFTWEEIGVVDGNGTSTSQHNYSAVDVNPFQGISYYRLLQVDFDGTGAYSTIRTVELNQGVNLLVTPNPFGEQCVIHLGTASNINTLEVINAMGQLVQTIAVEALDETILLDFTNMASGMYYLKADGVTLNQKLMKLD